MISRTLRLTVAFAFFAAGATACSSVHESANETGESNLITELDGGDAPFQPLDALGGCDQTRDIGILNNPQWGSYLLTGPNIPRTPNGQAMPPAMIAGGGCASLSHAKLVTAPADWASAEVISTCATPVSLRYAPPTTFVRPKTSMSSEHWMWACHDMPVNHTVLGAAAGCTAPAETTTAFECVGPKSVIEYGSAADIRMVTQASSNPYAYVCSELRAKQVCTFPGSAPTPIAP
jgi:hypothetical protein